jgi:hypothetical protein
MAARSSARRPETAGVAFPAESDTVAYEAALLAEANSEREHTAA